MRLHPKNPERTTAPEAPILPPPTPSTTGRTMTALTRTEYGSADVLRVGPHPIPTIEPDEVLVKVHAAGLDRGAWHLMYGQPYLVRPVFGVRAPKDPLIGLDLAGVVEEVGEQVTGFAPGDAVFGIGRGSFAQYAAAPARKLARMPQRMSFEQAAAVPVSGLTALQAVRDHGTVQPGQRVLVIGASGGVGSFAVQIAKAAGAQVTGVCRTGKVDLVRSLGADHVIDYTRDPITASDAGYDVILDIGGGRTIRELRRALTPDGTLVIIGAEGGGRWFGGLQRQLFAIVLSPFVAQKLGTFVASENARDLEDLRALIDAGKLRTAVDRVCPLADLPDAMRDLEAGRVRGKVVVTP
ncbi:MAG: NAD(P)-dependent alcohol dehydrogenase [Candidatus Nanopelagicales bacterium]